MTRFCPIEKRIWVERYNNFLYHMMVYWLSWKLNEWIGNEVSLWLTFHTARWRHWHAQKSQDDNAKCKLHGEWMAFPRTRDLQNKTEINHDKIDHPKLNTVTGWEKTYLNDNNNDCYIARLSLNKMSSVIGWFLATCPWSNSNVSRPGYNCAVVARTPPSFVCFCYVIV